MAEYYSVELGQKVGRNMKLNASKGYFNGGFVPLGYKLITLHFESNNTKYDKKKFVIDNETAPIVKKIFEMRASGSNIMEIVDYLNSKGYKNSKGKYFEKASLQTMLSNKRYIGINFYGDEEFPGTIPAIIDTALFDKVQAVKESFKHAPARAKAKEEYILTTKLFCGHCKNAMVGLSGTSSIGRTYYYYSCNGTRKKECHKKNVPKNYIEDIVVSKCKELLTVKNIDMIAKEVYSICQKENNQNTALKSLNKQKKEIYKNIENLMKAFESGQNIDLINDRLTANRNELIAVKKKIKTEESKLINLTKEQIKDFLLQLKNGNKNSIKYKKTLINIFVNKIFLCDDRLTIIFNVGKNPVTADFTLLEKATNMNNDDMSLYLNKLASP